MPFLLPNQQHQSTEGKMFHASYNAGADNRSTASGATNTVLAAGHCSAGVNAANKLLDLIVQ